MITLILSFGVGFVAGALVFRNNAAKGEKVVAAAKAAEAKVESVADQFKK